MAKVTKKVRRRRGVKKALNRRRRTVKKLRKVIRRKKVRRVSSILSLTARLKKHWETVLKDGLFARDKTTTAKGHRAAQRRIDIARHHLRNL